MRHDDIMQDQKRRLPSPEDQQQIHFWVKALLQSRNPAHAAQELYSIGVRTRGAVRTRGSAVSPAPSRFPPGTPIEDVLRLLKTEAAPEVRSGVAAALAEWGGGPETVGVLRQLVIGPERDGDAGVRAAALDAIGIIGGPEAIRTLEEVSTLPEEEETLQSMANGLMKALRQE